MSYGISPKASACMWAASSCCLLRSPSCLFAGIGISALPVTVLFGPIIAYNAAVILAYVLTGLTTYGLIRYLTRNRAGALVGSVTLNFCAV